MIFVRLFSRGKVQRSTDGRDKDVTKSSGTKMHEQRIVLLAVRNTRNPRKDTPKIHDKCKPNITQILIHIE